MMPDAEVLKVRGAWARAAAAAAVKGPPPRPPQVATEILSEVPIGPFTIKLNHRRAAAP